MRHPLHAAAAGLAAVLAVVALGAGPAAAHVSVNPPTASKGGFTKLTFRVPNERPGAETVKVEVFIPTDHPIANVSIKPVPGWTAAVERTKLATPVKTDDGDTISEAVSHVTWSGGAIKPGEFQEFDVSVGPLPDDAAQLVFKAIQTYSNGDVVRWIEEAAAGTSEPEHPAPVLKLTAASSDTAGAGSTATTAPSTTKDDSDDGGDDDSKGVAVAALVVAVVALLLGGAGLLRGRPRA